MLRVAIITDKIREARLKWYEHVMRTEDMIQQDSFRLKKEDTGDRNESGEEGSAWLIAPREESKQA